MPQYKRLNCGPNLEYGRLWKNIASRYHGSAIIFRMFSMIWRSDEALRNGEATGAGPGARCIPAALEIAGNPPTARRRPSFYQPLHSLRDPPQPAERENPRPLPGFAGSPPPPPPPASDLRRGAGPCPGTVMCPSGVKSHDDRRPLRILAAVRSVGRRHHLRPHRGGGGGAGAPATPACGSRSRRMPVSFKTFSAPERVPPSPCSTGRNRRTKP